MKFVPSPVSSPRPWSETMSEEPGTISCGNLIERILRDFHAGERLLGRFSGRFHDRLAISYGFVLHDYVLAVSLKVIRLTRLRSLARQRDHVPAEACSIIRVVHCGEHVSAQRLVRVLNADRRVEQRRKILAHVNSLLFAADENRNRPFRGVRDFGGLRQRQRNVGIGLDRFGFIRCDRIDWRVRPVHIAGRPGRFDGRSHNGSVRAMLA